MVYSCVFTGEIIIPPKRAKKMTQKSNRSCPLSGALTLVVTHSMTDGDNLAL